MQYICSMAEKMSVRERILDTASRLFYDQGYRATGINQIIEEASIAKSSLYQHFRTKDDLLVAYLKIAVKEWFEGLHENIGQNVNPAEQILGLFDYRAKTALFKKFKGCTFVRLAYELPNVEGEPAELVRKYKQAVRTYIKNAVYQLKGIGNADSKEQLTNIIYYLFEGAGVESSIYKSVRPITDAKQIVSVLINKN